MVPKCKPRLSKLVLSVNRIKFARNTSIGYQAQHASNCRCRPIRPKA